MTQYNGIPAIIQNNLPVAHNVSSSTHASPIVVATATNHMLSAGDVFVIAGAAVATVNGTWMAGTVTPTTVVLLNYPAATNSALPAGAGGAAGTLTSLGFGETYQIPDDATDGVTAASVNVGFEELGDRTAYLLYTGADKLSKTDGGTVAGDTTFTGTLTSSGKFVESGRRVRGARVSLTNANHTVAVTDGNRFELAKTSSVAATITLKSTGTVPTANETFEFLWVATASAPLPATAPTYTFQREDATVVATFTPSASMDDTPMWAEFEFSGGVWRLGLSSGSAADDGATPTRFGVVAGAGA